MAIQKLSEYKITSRDGSFINVECNTKIINTLVRKINELVDAVNELKKHEEQHLDLLTQLNEMRLQNAKKTESADQYAEQRGWIGCLCRFRHGLGVTPTYGILGNISPNSDFPYYKKDTDTYWKYCEPVKPDDDIIYKKD